MRQTVRVLIADDHPCSRKGLRALLATSSEIEVVAEATNGREAVQLAEEYQPDVVLLDARMPVMNGLEVTRHVKNNWPDIKVVLLTMYKNYLSEALAAGVDAFLVKGGPIDKIWEAVFALPTSAQPAPPVQALS